jgi:hypothetical protein
MGRSRLCAGKTGCETEQANAEVDKIVVCVQAQLDWTEIAQASESCNRDNRINRPKNQAELPRSINTLSKPGPKSDCAANEMKYIVSGRKCEIEHFVAKETNYTDDEQDRSA